MILLICDYHLSCYYITVLLSTQRVTDTCSFAWRRAVLIFIILIHCYEHCFFSHFSDIFVDIAPYIYEKIEFQKIYRY